MNKKTFLLISISALLLIILGSTYAFFIGGATGNNASSTVTTATLGDITYEITSPTNTQDVLPGWSGDGVTSVYFTKSSSVDVEYYCTMRLLDGSYSNNIYVQTINGDGQVPTMEALSLNEIVISRGTLLAETVSSGGTGTKHNTTYRLIFRETGTKQKNDQGQTINVFTTCKVNTLAYSELDMTDTLSGIITDRNGNPLKNEPFVAFSDPTYFMTDSNGHYEVQLRKGEHEIYYVPGKTMSELQELGTTVRNVGTQVGKTAVEKTVDTRVDDDIELNYTVPTYLVNVECTNCSPDQTQKEVLRRENISFTITPDTGYDINTAVVEGSCTIEGNTLTLTDALSSTTCRVTISETIYDITYNLDGGSATNPGTYNINTNTFTLNNPSKTGYTFIGWTGANGETPETSVSIAKGSTGNKTFTANYTANTYTLGYDLNNGVHGASHPLFATYDEIFNLDNPIKSVTINITNNESATLGNNSVVVSQIFNGWDITGMDSVTHYYGSNTTANTSLSNITDTSFKNLRGTDGTVSFTARWTPVDATLPSISKTGNTCGYSSSNNNEIEYTNIYPKENILENSSVLTIYAVCNENTYTVTLDKNGGTGGTSTIYQKYNTGWYINEAATSQITTSSGIAIPTMVGYDFAGYYYGSTKVIDASGKLVSGVSTTLFTDVATLTASWTLKSLSCNAGNYMPANSDVCQTCPKGSYCTAWSGTYDAAEHGRNLCSAGTANNSTGQSASSACVKCVASSSSTQGTYSASAGSATCTALSTGGQYIANAGATGATTCPAGYACSGGKIVGCVASSASVQGTYSSAGASSCTALSTAGQYIASANASSATTCPKGYYCTGGKIIACSAGTANNSTGQSAATACVKCVASSSSTQGTYSASAGSATCTALSTNGQYIATAGATGASTCPKGYYCSGGKVTACSAGTANNSTGQSASSACVKCIASSASVQGTYSSAGAATCTALSTAGQYVASAGASGPSTCPAGYACSGGKITGCVKSTASVQGTYSSAGASSCTALSTAGQYIASANASSASTCPKGYYCTGGKIIACAAGTANGSTGQSASSACVKCVASSASVQGTYSSAGAAACTALSTGGQYVASAGASGPSTCPAGYACSGGKIVGCVASSASVQGTYSSAGASSCTALTTGGKYIASNNASGTTNCPAGYACSGGKITGCVKSTASVQGTYSSAGASSCTALSTAGQYIAANNASSATTCPKGYYCASGKITACSAGTANGSTGQSASTACVKCVASTASVQGTYAASAGSTACTGAGNGVYVASAGATGTTTCPKGYACSGGKVAACVASSASTQGTYAASTGSTSCTALTTAGQYIASAGASGATTCPKGYYCASGKITACAKGTANGSTGQSAASACKSCVASSSSVQGTYAASTGSSACTALSTAGQYIASAGASAATTCPAGYYCASGKIYACSKGTYNASTGQSASSACKTCPAGSYSASTNSTACTACTGGKTGSAGAQAACTTTCSNSTGVATWKTTTWNSSNNTVSNLCVPNTCSSGYKLNAAGTACEVEYTYKYWTYKTTTSLVWGTNLPSSGLLDNYTSYSQNMTYIRVTLSNGTPVLYEVCLYDNGSKKLFCLPPNAYTNKGYSNVNTLCSAMQSALSAPSTIAGTSNSSVSQCFVNLNGGGQARCEAYADGKAFCMVTYGDGYCQIDYVGSGDRKYCMT